MTSPSPTTPLATMRATLVAAGSALALAAAIAPAHGQSPPAGPFVAPAEPVQLQSEPVQLQAQNEGVQAQNEEGQITDLGVAMQSINVRLSAVGELEDGTPVGYLFSDGEPVSLDVVDLRSGGLLDHHEMDPYTVASSIAVADDGTVYLSVRSPNDATLWRYTPAEAQLEQVATGIAGEEMLRTLDVDGDTLYGTTYPNANVYALNLGTEEIIEYGRIAPEGDYAWGLDAEQGRVWVGAGTPAQLLTLDPDDGTTSSVALPEAVAEQGEFIQRIETYGDLTIVSHREIDGISAHLHDGADWVDTLDIAGMWHYTEDTADGAFFYLDTNFRLWSYDVEAKTATQEDLTGTGIEDALGGTSQMFLTELGGAEFPGKTVLGVRPDGQIWRYNLQTGHSDVLETGTQGAPVTIMSLAPGGDRQVYVGAYLSAGVMARIDPATDEITPVDGPEQADAITAHGSSTFIGTYPNAEIYQADHGEPWEWGTNPRHVLTLGRAETGQDRPRHMTSTGDLVAIGTIPNYGELGGGLTLFDPETGEHEFTRDVVADQSVTDLTHSGGVVYGGTSIHGGLDSTPTQETAELFAWDIEEGLIASSPVVDGAEVIHSLTFDSDGRLWAMADTGELVAYDTTGHDVVRSIDTGIAHSNIWGSSSALDLNPQDGLIYGSAGGRLFSFDPDTEDITILVESGVQRSTLADGDIFYTDATNVYRYHLGAAEPVCDEEITGSHRGPLHLDQGTTCLSGASVRGPVTIADGASVVMSGSDLMGPFRADGAAHVRLEDNNVTGPVQIIASTGEVSLAGNTIIGSLSCSGNISAPSGRDNAVRGPAMGQCSELGTSSYESLTQTSTTPTVIQ